ncbi:zinc finger protein 333-like isoform X3 [Leopardus geoffroyi]|uniref:zinc finger protein 333-like isoform X3 n=1 Tax=Leopardus geoffroyi TaxID=46844 RepID=UPI001E25E4B2|nr:zinc finger protein 333-like isoform X3 [Leopardus geoffroyi]
MESVTFEDVAVGLLREWALLDGARTNLCRYVILDKCRTLAPKDWDSRLKSQASPPVQDILEGNSSPGLHMGRKAAAQIQRVAVPVPALSLPELRMAGE